MAESSLIARPAVSIKRQTLWSMMPLLVISAVNIFSVPLFIRYLGHDMYALMGYIATFTGMFGFADLGLGFVVGRYVGMALGKGEHDAVRAYWGTGNLIVIPLVVTAALAFMVVGVWIGPKWFNVEPGNVGLLRACFITGGFGLFFNYYSQFWNSLSQAHLDFKFIGILRTGVTLFQAVPQVGLAILTGNPLWVIAWGVGTAFLGLIVFMWHGRRQYDLGFDLRAASFARAREMAAYVGKSVLGLMSGALLGSFDRLILSGLASAANFNYYRIAADLGTRVQGLSSAVMGPVYSNTNRAVGGGRSGSIATIYNETFTFVFDWYLLVAVWLGAWHPVLLRLWLGPETGGRVAPLLMPIIVAACITAIAGISNSQLYSINRVGTAIGFSTAAGLLGAAGAVVGWRVAGPLGIAYGVLASRVVLIAQDLYTIRLVGGGGWRSLRTWKHAGAQVAVGAIFALSYLVLPRGSLWVLVPALLHGGLVAAWLLRHPLRKLIA